MIFIWEKVFLLRAFWDFNFRVQFLSFSRSIFLSSLLVFILFLFYSFLVGNSKVQHPPSGIISDSWVLKEFAECSLPISSSFPFLSWYSPLTLRILCSSLSLSLSPLLQPLFCLHRERKGATFLYYIYNIYMRGEVGEKHQFWGDFGRTQLVFGVSNSRKWRPFLDSIQGLEIWIFCCIDRKR